jgi:hypothetical protein
MRDRPTLCKTLVKPHEQSCDGTWCESTNNNVHVINSCAVIMAGNHTGQIWGQWGLKSQNEDLRFEVFTAVSMKNDVFWDVTPCGSCKNRRFGGV